MHFLLLSGALLGENHLLCGTAKKVVGSGLIASSLAVATVTPSPLAPVPTAKNHNFSPYPLCISTRRSRSARAPVAAGDAAWGRPADSPRALAPWRTLCVTNDKNFFPNSFVEGSLGLLLLFRHTYPLSTPRTRLSMKKEPMMISGTK